MKIEKINDHQIQFILMPQDLIDRNISIRDIITRAPGKADVLFQEITSILATQFHFRMDATPLVFEARAESDTIYIVVTKLEHNMGMNNLSGVMGNVIAPTTGAFGMPEQGFATQHPLHKPEHTKTDLKKILDSHYAVFSFRDIDTLAEAASQISGYYMGRSKVYSIEGKYCLLLHSVDIKSTMARRIEGILGEYGNFEGSNKIIYSQVLECGKVIIVEDAVRKLKSYSSM